VGSLRGTGDFVGGGLGHCGGDGGLDKRLLQGCTFAWLFCVRGTGSATSFFFGAHSCCCLVLFLTLLLHFQLPFLLYVALVVLLFTCARKTVMEPSTNAVDPGTNAAERRLYVQFF